MTHLIRENAVERFEASNVDLLEELHVMMAAAEPDMRAVPSTSPAPRASSMAKSLLARWFSHDADLAA
ncbi:MAG TPA: hypothetical protein VGB82_27695 [Alphaproteobacteria bacterium]